MPELISPAGSLEAGIHALIAGADGVYFGLERFSARQSAKNLTPKDMRRLSGFAKEHNKKLFLAVNTIITQEELSDVVHLIKEAYLAEVDAVIVQDLGLAKKIKQTFPDVKLHGSTQLAVHTTMGLDAARRMSLRRVVLSRELSLKEIAAMKSSSPEVEREVFVHGALCYGFSGLCLASSHLTERSGNRGECAQICRSWFENQNNTDKKKGYFFSAADLHVGTLIRKLAESGVSALKIEGRLKSDPYVFNTTAYYRALLEGDDEKAAHYQEKSSVCFARSQTSGFLKSIKHSSLINADYPSHRGIPGAVVLSINANKMRIRALTNLSSKDRLFRIPVSPPDDGEIIVMTTFVKSGRRVKEIEPDDIVEIDLIRKIRVGDILVKTLSHNMHLKTPTSSCRSEYKRSFPLFVFVEEGHLRLKTQLMQHTVEESYPVTVECSIGESSFDSILKQLFAESKDNAFCLVLNNCDLAVPYNIFVPPSQLKRIRNDFYSKVNERLITETKNKIANMDFSQGSIKQYLSIYDLALPQRSSIRYKNDFMFITENAIGEISDWPKIDNHRYLSLPPVMFREQTTIDTLEQQLTTDINEQIRVGLNNISHLSIADKWSRFNNVSFFIDYGLYTANMETLLYFSNSVKKLNGAYLWIEANQEQIYNLQLQIGKYLKQMPQGLSVIDNKYLFPMFISRICFHNAIDNKNKCYEKCPKHFVYKLKQQQRLVKAQVEDCITYITLLNPKHSQ